MNTSWVALLSALLAGTCVSLWLVSPGEQLKRSGRSQSSTGRIRRVPGWPPARSDAAPLPRRLIVSAAAGVAVGLGMAGQGGTFAPLGWVLIPVLTAVGAIVLGRLEPAVSRQRRQRLVMELPQALQLMSACLAAGMPLRTATDAVAAAFEGPVHEDLNRVLALVDLGFGDAEAWRSLRTDPLWGATAVDLARSVESGTMMVDVLVHHAGHARSRRRAELEVGAKAVGVRSVLPLMTCFLPAFLLLGVVPTVASAILNALS